MSIAERIAEEHQWVTQPDGQQKECTCGALIAMHPADDPLPFHVAELTERAVREHITAELDEWQPEMTTEWAHMLDGGGASIHRTRQEAEQAQRDYLHQQANLYPVDDPPGPPSAGIYRREVTEWKKSD